MKKLVIAALATVLAAVPAQALPTRDALDSTEGCQAFNPGQPTCSYKPTHSSATPVAGVAGVGKWVVIVKKGRKKTTIKSPPSGEPTAVEVVFPKGATVTAKALSPGSGLTVGHAD